MIKNGLEAAAETGAAIAAMPVKDTIKKINDGIFVSQTLPRNELWGIQTPQVFRYDIITEAYRCIKNDVTDDAAMVESMGIKVKVFRGAYDNIKITTPEDVAIAECLLRRREQGTG